ncbi:uncharacterized protein TNCV_4125881 [Trichonephila clavipes]|nr:uncharacterized protein TNCV_4125881 [Trichonephila clavipes]
MFVPSSPSRSAPSLSLLDGRATYKEFQLPGESYRLDCIATNKRGRVLAAAAFLMLPGPWTLCTVAVLDHAWTSANSCNIEFVIYSPIVSAKAINPTKCSSIAPFEELQNLNIIVVFPPFTRRRTVLPSDSSNDEFGKITLSSAFGENVEAKLIKTAIALDNNSLNHPMDCLVAITDKLNADALIPPALYESLCSINDKNNKKENEIFAESTGSSITFSNDENEAECGKDIFYVE